MFCAYGDRLGRNLNEAREAFDIAETQSCAATYPLEARSKERTDAGRKLVDARFAFVVHKAGCEVCMSDQAPTSVGVPCF